jgi:hypothetical protein
MERTNVMNYPRRSPRLMVVGSAACVCVLIGLALLWRNGGAPSVASSPLQVAPSSTTMDSPRELAHQESAQVPVVPPKGGPIQDQQSLGVTSPTLDKSAIESHRGMLAGLNSELRDRTKELYTPAFQQLGLSANLQEKVIDILTSQQQQFEAQAFAAAQSGGVPSIPSPEEMRMQQAQQNNQLRSALGEKGFAQFSQYQASIPDRIVVDQMNQQGANLSDSQSAQVLQALSDSRQQIFGAMPNLSSMAPEQAVAAIQQKQTLLQQTVSDRVQSILTPDQGRTLQTIISGINNPPPGK